MNLLLKQFYLFVVISIILLFTILGCRSRFGYIQGTQSPINYQNDKLKVYASSERVYTKGNPGSGIIFVADCQLPGITNIEWDFADNTPKKLGSMIKHSFIYAQNYMVVTKCSNSQRMIATAKTLIKVQYKDPSSSSTTLPAASLTHLDIPCKPYLDTETNQIKYNCNSFDIKDSQENKKNALNTSNQKLPYVLAIPSTYLLDSKSDPDKQLNFQAKCFNIENPRINWDFGDGSDLASGIAVSHKFSEIGEYEVTSTCVDGKNSDIKAKTKIIIKIK